MDGWGLRMAGRVLLAIGVLVAWVTLFGVRGFRLEGHETILLLTNAVGAWLIAGVVALAGGTIVDAIVAKQSGEGQPPSPPTD